MTDKIRTVAAGESGSPSALLALGCIGLMAGASPAVAQDVPETARPLGRVTVTDTEIDESFNRAESSSPRHTAPLVDTPQTVSVIPREIIRERGARTLADVLQNTPGISFDAGENGFGTSSNNFMIRGFDSSGSVFTDNARDSGSYTRDVFNVEAVEVVKGPAADNGRGTAGGYVNLVSKTPLAEGFAAADFSAGFDQYGGQARMRGSIDVNQQIGAQVAVRLNGVYDYGGVPGREFARNEVWGIAPSVAFGLGTPFRVIAMWERQKRSDRPDWGVPGATMPNTPSYDPLTEGAPRDAFYGLATDFDDSTADTLLGRVEYDLREGITLSNQLRWSRVERTARFTTPNGFTPATGMVPTSTLFYARENSSVTNMTNLSAKFATGSLTHSLAAGVELSWEDSDADRFGAAVPPSGNTSLWNPNAFRAGAAPLNPTETARADINTVAFYLFDTIELSERFQITGGIRGENYNVELESLTAAGLPTTPPSAADGYDRSEFTLGGRLGLVFKPTAESSVYASFGTSALPPGSYLSNPDISRTGDNAFPGFVPNAKPVRSYNYEIGVKWDFFGGALSTTAALFRAEKRNVAVTGREAGETVDSLKGYQTLVAQGLELGIAGAITPEWNIFGGLLVMDTERQISEFLDDVRRRANPADYGTATRTDGDRLAFTPNVSANLWTTYRLPFGVTLGGGLQHIGSSYLGRPDDALRIIPNSRYGKVPAYTIVNAMLGWELAEKVDLRLNIDNIANKHYAVTTNWNGSRATLGSPRTFLASVGFQF